MKARPRGLERHQRQVAKVEVPAARLLESAFGTPARPLGGQIQERPAEGPQGGPARPSEKTRFGGWCDSVRPDGLLLLGGGGL